MAPRLQIKRALRSAARLPSRLTTTLISPSASEAPLVLLRIQILGCSNLAAKDRSGSSDPFVVVSISGLGASARHQTPVVKRTLNPTYAPREATWEVPIYVSQVIRGPGVGALEVVVWDRDMVGKDYLGEAAIPLASWFEGTRGVGWDEPGNKPFTINLESTRVAAVVSGAVHIKLGFVRPPHPQTELDLDEIYAELVKRSRLSLVSAPPTEGIGTIASSCVLEDDGGISSDEAETDNENDNEGITDESDQEYTDALEEPMPENDERAVPILTIEPSSPITPVVDVHQDPRTPTQKLVQQAITGVLGSANSATPTTPSANLVSTISPTTPGASVVSSISPTTPSVNLVSSISPISVPSNPSAATAPKLPIPAPTPTTKKKIFPMTIPSIPKPNIPNIPSPIGPIRRFSGLGSPSPSPHPSSVASPSISSTPSIPPPISTIDPITGTTVPGTPAPATEDTVAAVNRRSRLFGMGKGMGITRRDKGGSAPPTPSAASADGSDPLALTSAGESSASDAGRNVKEGRRRKIGRGKWDKGSDDKDGKRDRNGKGKGKAYELDVDGGNDVMGIVMLEVVKAEDLPRLRNMTRTSFDMDPFAVVSFGKKVFRTRVIRHSLNPTWDEKLLFHVRRHEVERGNGWRVMIQQLIDLAPQKDPETGMYDSAAEEGSQPMVELKLQLKGEEGREPPEWEAEGRHVPVVYLRAKYQPYDLLRHRFWRKYLVQYDTDDTRALSNVELTSALDSLGSTLTSDTIDAFWHSRGKNPQADELSMEEAIVSLEEVLGRPVGERRRVDGGGEGDKKGEGERAAGDMSVSESSTSLTPAEDMRGDGALGLDFSKMNFGGGIGAAGIGASTSTDGAGSSSAYSSDDAAEPGELSFSSSASPPSRLSEGVGAAIISSSMTGAALATAVPKTLAPPRSQIGVISGGVNEKKKTRFRRPRRTRTLDTSLTPSSNSNNSLSGSSPGPSTPGYDMTAVERVINVKSCPLCHRPRMSGKGEVDIVTHIAVCASADWNRVGRIVVGEYVTASQAQRKWYTKMITKISSGDYKLGANSANIIVQNRMTGQLEEEKMQTYVRFGIRLLYKGATSRMEGGRARRLLRSLSVKQGVKYDSPASVADIPGFIEFHGLNISEIQDPLESFKTFNQFFYRRLKPSARPIECPDDPYRLVSAADCRLMTFASVDEATRLWIKGREFSIEKLLGETYRGEAERFRGGALVIFRLAPQDYHRFHSPVEGVVGPMVFVKGEYYTVNPQAIRSSLDVYGENVRKIVPIDSPQFGRVMAVCVGAMMVGSIKTTVQEGDHINGDADEVSRAVHVCLAGGSTIVVIFEKDRVEWDEDLLINGRASLETLVRVGTGIGKGRRPVGA
ncbi:hypothetical protein H0H92_000943 [Tricholoma furcatifolium]|nr:hypothetical protein H0H92_000943 [Tricholoma furcatifolium]